MKKKLFKCFVIVLLAIVTISLVSCGDKVEKADLENSVNELKAERNQLALELEDLKSRLDAAIKDSQDESKRIEEQSNDQFDAVVDLLAYLFDEESPKNVFDAAYASAVAYEQEQQDGTVAYVLSQRRYTDYIEMYPDPLSEPTAGVPNGNYIELDERSEEDYTITITLDALHHQFMCLIEVSEYDTTHELEDGEYVEYENETNYSKLMLMNGQDIENEDKYVLLATFQRKDAGELTTPAAYYYEFENQEASDEYYNMMNYYMNEIVLGTFFLYNDSEKFEEDPELLISYLAHTDFYHDDTEEHIVDKMIVDYEFFDIYNYGSEYHVNNEIDKVSQYTEITFRDNKIDNVEMNRVWTVESNEKYDFFKTLGFETKLSAIHLGVKEAPEAYHTLSYTKLEDLEFIESILRLPTMALFGNNIK